MAEDVATLSGQRCTQPGVISGGELVTGEHWQKEVHMATSSSANRDAERLQQLHQNSPDMQQRTKCLTRTELQNQTPTMLLRKLFVTSTSVLLNVNV